MASDIDARAGASPPPEPGKSVFDEFAESAIATFLAITGDEKPKTDLSISPTQVPERLDKLLDTAATSIYTRSRSTALLEVGDLYEQFPAQIKMAHVLKTWAIIEQQGDSYVRAQAMDDMNIVFRVQPKFINKPATVETLKIAVNEHDKKLVTAASRTFYTIMDNALDTIDGDCRDVLLTRIASSNDDRCRTAITLLHRVFERAKHLANKESVKKVANVHIPKERWWGWELVIPQQSFITYCAKEHGHLFDPDILETLALRAALHKNPKVREVMFSAFNNVLETQAHHVTDRLTKKLEKISAVLSHARYGLGRSKMAKTIRDAISDKRQDLKKTTRPGFTSRVKTALRLEKS